MRQAAGVIVTCAASALLVSPAWAQIDRPSWGIIASVAPLWTVPAPLGRVFNADTFEIKGHDLRIGLIRGTTFGGEWGITLVHKRLSPESVLGVRQPAGVVSIVVDDAEMVGVEVHRFFPFARAGRVQIGVAAGGGIAQMRGFVTGSVRAPDGASVGAPISFSELVTLAGRDWELFPLGRVELAAATRVGDRVKVRVGSGFNMPGLQLASVSVSWLLGSDR